MRIVESMGLLAGAGAFVLMGTHIPLIHRPDLVLVLALSSALTARALYVPSSARRTFVLSLAVGLVIGVGVYFMWLEVDAAPWEALFPNITEVPKVRIALGLVANTLAWWTVTTAITTAASRVIYGLRRDIRDARQLGQYRLEHKIGEGGMGAVYRASHALLKRATAVKLLLPSLTGADNLPRCLQPA